MPAIFTRDFERQFMLEIDNSRSASRLQVFNLGGVSGAGGGSGAPPGGFIGKLAQKYVTYDSTESCASGIPTDPNLTHNLNRIRGGFAICDGAILPRHLASGIGTLSVKDYRTQVNQVATIFFSGATVSNLGGGTAYVRITASGIDRSTGFVIDDVFTVGNTNSNYSTIQSAVDAVPDYSGIILVTPGGYNESVTLNNDIIITGMTYGAKDSFSETGILSSSSKTIDGSSRYFSQFNNLQLINSALNGAVYYNYPGTSTTYTYFSNCSFISNDKAIDAEGTTVDNGAIYIKNCTVSGKINVKKIPLYYENSRGGVITLSSGTAHKIIGGYIPSLTVLPGTTVTLIDLPQIDTLSNTGTIKGPYTDSNGKINNVNFTDLNDVPSSYTSQKLRVPRVKLDETGLEFVTVSGGGGGPGSTSFITLTDVPGSYTGAALQVVRVKSTEDGLEFVTASGGGGGGAPHNLLSSEHLDTTPDTGILGDLIISSGTTWRRFAGNTLAAKRYLSQTGTGAASASPVWDDVTLENARVAVSKNSGGATGIRKEINLIEGAGTTLTISDDSVNERINITITTSGSAAYAIMDEGLIGNYAVMAM